MKENHDYVTMATYKADMADLGEQATAVAAALREEITTLESTIWMIVKAAGGKVSIPHDIIVGFDKNRAVREITYNPVTMATEIKALSAD